MTFHIIIPSALPDNLIQCVNSIVANEPEFPTNKIIVIDDGSRLKAESVLPPLTWIRGISPFVFARNVNLGLKYAKGDVILLNDDATLLTFHGFTKLAEAGKHCLPGIISPAIKGRGGHYQKISSKYIMRAGANYLAFMCVFIPRIVISQLGFLNEEYTSYGYEDLEYSDRANENGIPLYVFQPCVVEHEHIEKSTFRSDLKLFNKYRFANAQTYRRNKKERAKAIKLASSQDIYDT